MNFGRRHRTRWAAIVLFAWLFGLASGMANACALAADHPPHAGAMVAPHDDHDDAVKASCLDFCAQASLATPSVEAAFHAIDVLALPARATLQVVAPNRDAPRLGAAATELPDRGSAPPIPIALLRLAL